MMTAPHAYRAACTSLNVLALIAAFPLVSQANVLVNGSFEDPIVPDSNGNGWITVLSGFTIGDAGWVVDQNSVDVHTREYATKWNCADGLQGLDLTGNSAGTIHQDANVSSGDLYHLSFAMSANLAFAPEIVSLEVWVDSEKLGQVDFDTRGKKFQDMGWEYHSFEVLATSPTMRVEFRSLTGGTCGPAIDDVRLDFAPTPETLGSACALSLSLLGCIGLLRRLS